MVAASPHLEPLQRRVRHDPGVVDDGIDPPVGAHRVIDEAHDLLVLRHVGLHGGAIAQRELNGERLSRSSRRAPSTSLARCWASRRAVAAPFPLLAPVMTTTLSSIACVTVLPSTLPFMGSASAQRMAGARPLR